MDGTPQHIYLVVDNYSRMIISYAVSTKKSAHIMMNTIKRAYQKTLEMNPSKLNIELIVDGGGENNNKYVEGFTNKSNIHIKKLIALKDTTHSNSAVEAVNKTLKYHYLFPKPSENKFELRKHLKKYIYDYNEVRPHGRLTLQTPYEAWMGLKPNVKLIREQIENAEIQRVQYNKDNTCNQCFSLI